MTAESSAEPMRFRAFGDSALLVELGTAIDIEVNRRARLLAELVERHRVLEPALGRAVPSYASVLIPFDPLALDSGGARSIVERLVAEKGGLSAPDEPDDSRFVTIPVRYGGDDGPDLTEVAGRVAMSPSDVVRVHASRDYHVYMLGFAPGFAYMGPLDARLAVPRRSTPRERVPAGSVAIAAGQTAVYPSATPGGWWLIGRTDEWLWNVERDPPARLRPGDRVRFVPI